VDVQQVRIADIKVGKRFRQDMGDLAKLINSMGERGLLQPIVIDTQNRLRCGQRRLKAAKQLGWTHIDAQVIANDDDLINLQIEHDENEVRKQFTVSERVAIADTIKAKIKAKGERRGRPKADKTDSEKIVSSPDIINSPSGLSETAAAKAAGFDNRAEYLRAKEVVEHGTPETVAAMDAEEVSVSAAAEVAALPPKQQPKALKAKKQKQTDHFKTAEEYFGKLIRLVDVICNEKKARDDVRDSALKFLANARKQLWTLK